MKNFTRIHTVGHQAAYMIYIISQILIPNTNKAVE